MEIDIDKIKDALDNSNLMNTHKDLYWKLWKLISNYEFEEAYKSHSKEE